MEKQYFKINQVASFLGIQASTLRYYEEYGLLKPAYIDETTKYRYYDLSNIDTIGAILSLRQSNMNMTQIKNYLNGNYSRETFISELKAQRDNLNRLIEINETYCTDSNHYNVNIIEIDGFYSYGKEYFAESLQEIYQIYSAFMIEALPVVSGANNSLAFIEFDTLQPECKNLKLFIGLPLKNSKNSNKYYKPFKAIQIFHKGTYETLGNAYIFICNYMKENYITPVGNSIEYYHESFNQQPLSKDFLTEIIVPLQCKL